MKFVHVSDIHLGKKLKTIRGDLELDFCSALKQIKEIIDEVRPNFVFICGDVFHHKNHSADVEEMFIEFLIRIYDYVDFIFIISGNHDNEKRLYNFSLFNKFLSKGQKIFIYTSVDLMNDIKDEKLSPFSFGEVDIVFLPFLEYKLALNAFYNLDIPKEFAYSFVYSSIMRDFLQKSRGKFKFLLGHMYVENSVLGNSEARNYINDSYYVRLGDIDESFVYVALGHVHKFQKIGTRNIYYSGSIIPLDFGENFDHGIVVGQIVNNFPKIEFIKLSYKEFITIRESKNIFDEIEKNKDKFVKVIYKNLKQSEIERVKLFDNVIKLHKEVDEYKGFAEKNESISFDPFDVIGMYEKFYHLEKSEKLPDYMLDYLQHILQKVEL